MGDLFMEREAILSDCGRYRYLLRRAWDYDRMRALFVMLNPSTADAEVDDATIRSCIRLCLSWSYGSFEVVNLFAWRATDPNELMNGHSLEELVGPDTVKVIDAAVNRCDVAICAWGAHPAAAVRRGDVWRSLCAAKPEVYCLGTTKSGAPKHPLYIKTGTPLIAYRPA